MRTTLVSALFAVGLLAPAVGCGSQGSGAEQSTEALGAADKSQPPSYDALDSAIVDAVVQRYAKALPAAAAKTLPAAIVCSGTTIDAFATQKLTTDSGGSEILLDQTDGDQVAGFLFSKADLEALASKKTAKIAAKAYSGYWWSDGSHYSFGNATCKLK